MTSQREKLPASDVDGDERATRGEGGEDGMAEDPIDAQLRRLYRDAADEPLPDKLVQLLERLAEADKRR